jgi:YaiO family outer membrane protein
MIARGGFLLAALFGVSLLAPPAWSRTAGELYRDGVVARQEGRFSAAVSMFEEALRLQPENADIHLQLGYARLAEGDLAGAEKSFARTLEIAPGYEDARLGLAHVAFRRGDSGGARRLVAHILRVQPENAEAQALFRRIVAAEAQPDQHRWRFDAVSERSELSGGRRHWTDSAVNLSYGIDRVTTAAARLRVAERRGLTDVQIEARFDRQLAEGLSVYGAVAVTPDTDFLARTAFSSGGSWRALRERAGWGPLNLLLDVRYEIYPGARIWTAFPGVEYRLARGLFGVSARWVHAEDDGSAVADGYIARLDIAPEERIGGFVGYADAPEISQGVLTDTQTLFGGLAWRANDRLTLRFSLAREERMTFDRNTVGIGFTTRF